MKNDLEKILIFSKLPTIIMYKAIDLCKSDISYKEARFIAEADKNGFIGVCNTHLNFKKEFEKQHGFSFDWDERFLNTETRNKEAIWKKVKAAIPCFDDLYGASIESVVCDSELSTIESLQPYNADYDIGEVDFNGTVYIYELTDDISYLLCIVRKIQVNFLSKEA